MLLLDKRVIEVSMYCENLEGTQVKVLPIFERHLCKSKSNTISNL